MESVRRDFPRTCLLVKLGYGHPRAKFVFEYDIHSAFMFVMPEPGDAEVEVYGVRTRCSLGWIEERAELKLDSAGSDEDVVCPKRLRHEAEEEGKEEMNKALKGSLSVYKCMYVYMQYSFVSYTISI